MDCEYCATLLNGALDGTLEEREAADFNLHIASCAECRARFEAELTIQNAAPGLIAEPPETLLAEVMYNIGKKPGRRFAFGHFTAFAALAAALLMVAYYGGFWPQSVGGARTLTGALNGAPEISADQAAPEAAPMAPAALFEEPQDFGAGEVLESRLLTPEAAPAPDAESEEKAESGGVYLMAESIAPAVPTDTSDMSLVWQCENLQFEDDQAAVLSLYTAAETGDDGELLFDDGQDWALLMSTSQGEYPLFARRYVQLGVVSCAVFLDEADVFHVIVTVTQTAGYETYDCVYDSATKTFSRVPVYERGGINFIGRSG